MKQCKKCLEYKNVECFLANKQCKDGRLGSCRECVNKRRRELQLQHGSYYTKHRERALERAKTPEVKARRKELYYKRLGKPVPEKRSLKDGISYESYFKRIVYGLNTRRDHIPKYTDLNPEILRILMILQDDRCFYTNLPISLKENTASLDRLDNTKGYISNNVRWVHKNINFMKGPLSHELFCEFCKLVAETHCKAVWPDSEATT